MRFVVQYPIQSDVEGGAWLNPQNIIRFTQAAEVAGLDAISLTDHPAPSRKWLEGGGHETLDPFVGLAFCAAVTSRIRLMTHLIVVPYRNPLLQARSMAALDVLSGGRATFVLGTGYLRSEFAALGVDFEERNELFDEAVEVIRGIWAADSLPYAGRHFTLVDQVIKPAPIQLPHPPLWVGGNSKIALDRVARWGQGWAPMQGPAQQARTSRTPPISSDEQLTEALRELTKRLEANGRTLSAIDVLAGSTAFSTASSADERIEELARLAELGITWTSVQVPHDRFDDAIEALQRFGDEIAPKVP